MSGYENIKDKGFDKRDPTELREISSRAGKASGEARRRKANFRNTLNQLLTIEIDDEEWAPMLKAMGLDCTLETALNMKMIKQGLEGDVKAYKAVAQYSGQSVKDDIDAQSSNADIRLKEETLRHKKAETAYTEAKTTAEKKKNHDDVEVADDGFLEALNGSAKNDWSDYEEDNSTI